MGTGYLYGHFFGDLSIKGCVFVNPAIPRFKIDNAIANFAHGVDPDDVILLLDKSISENGSCGFLVTREALYYAERFESPHRIDLLEETHHFGATSGTFQATFCADGRELIASMSIGHIRFAAIAERINKLNRGEFEEPVIGDLIRNCLSMEELFDITLLADQDAASAKEKESVDLRCQLKAALAENEKLREQLRNFSRSASGQAVLEEMKQQEQNRIFEESLNSQLYGDDDE